MTTIAYSVIELIQELCALVSCEFNSSILVVLVALISRLHLHRL